MKARLNRRKFIVLGLLFATGAIGINHYLRGSGGKLPPGWKWERWEAGFGSWANGGFGVAYWIAIPESYHFLEKWGSAWVSDDLSDDFAIKFSFIQGRDANSDFDDYKKYHGGKDPLILEKATVVMGNNVEYTRQEFTAHDFPFLEDVDEKSPKDGVFRGFWQTSKQISIVAALRDPKRFAIAQQIVQTVRRA